jgi:hypothetical protein
MAAGAVSRLNGRLAMTEKRQLRVRGPDGAIIEGATAEVHADEDGWVARITMPGGARIDGRGPAEHNGFGMSFVIPPDEDPELPPVIRHWEKPRE